MAFKKIESIKNIFIQYDLTFNDDIENPITIRNILPESKRNILSESKTTAKAVNLYDAIFLILSKNDKVGPQDIYGNPTIIQDINTSKIRAFLNKLSYPRPKDIFDNIAEIVKETIPHNFVKYEFMNKYNLFKKEDSQKFITIDPTIIQIMIFDDDVDNIYGNNDIVYSLKLIKRNINQLTLRYTTQLFPNNSQIIDFKRLSYFNAFNKSLGNKYIEKNYDSELSNFLKKYINFYLFYKKCYTIYTCEKTEKQLVDYQLKYISILGKARFGERAIKQRASLLTDYVMSNLIFTSPSYAFISGGYKGFKQDKYGITRSGYEIAKKYNRPILTIMCVEGMHDSHEYSDATLIYGEHWGEDSIALSQLTDGAIVIAPFGGWTSIECLTLLANKKIIGIYNDLYNILNYEKKPSDLDNTQDIFAIKKELPNISKDDLDKLINKKNKNKYDNINFFKFAPQEQTGIIDLYINYYLILLYILDDVNAISISNIIDFKNCIEYGIKILTHLKLMFLTEKKNAEKKNDLSDNFILLITTFNKIKDDINYNVKVHMYTINSKYSTICDDTDYQKAIPEKCDGIWIKPSFNLIDNCITSKRTRDKIKEVTQKSSASTNNNAMKRFMTRIISGRRQAKEKLSGGACEIDDSIFDTINEYTINIDVLKTHLLFSSKYINNSIIFVFSDVMYLNMYLNKNLNTSSFQEKIHKKIDDILSATLDSKNSKTTTKDLLNDERNKYIDLNRNMDGMFNTETGQIINDNIIREKYSFIINESCNNYTSFIKEIIKSC
jgi:hypothetical protein